MKANIVFRNGEVLTVDKHDGICEAVAVKNGKIIFCGSDAAVADYCDSATQIIDLSGRTLIPGFINSGHVHCGYRRFRNSL